MDRIRKLVNAGLKISLSERTAERLDQLNEEEVEQLIGICKKLTDKEGGASLVYTPMAWSQPPHSKY